MQVFLYKPINGCFYTNTSTANIDAPEYDVTLYLKNFSTAAHRHTCWMLQRQICHVCQGFCEILREGLRAHFLCSSERLHVQFNASYQSQLHWSFCRNEKWFDPCGMTSHKQDRSHFNKCRLLRSNKQTIKKKKKKNTLDAWMASWSLTEWFKLLGFAEACPSFTKCKFRFKAACIGALMGQVTFHAWSYGLCG